MNLAEFRAQLQNPPKWVFAFLVAAALGVASFVRAGAFDEATSRVAQVRADDEKTQRVIRLSAGLEEQIATLDKAYEAAKVRMIDPEKRGENLKHFFSLAQEHSVNLEAVAPLPLNKMTHFNAAPFRLLVRGKFEEVVKFVRKVERGPYFFAPRDYRIQKDEQFLLSDASSPKDEIVSLAMNFDFVAP